MLKFIIIWNEERDAMKNRYAESGYRNPLEILITAKGTLKFCPSFKNPITKLERYYVARDKYLTFIGWSYHMKDFTEKGGIRDSNVKLNK